MESKTTGETNSDKLEAFFGEIQALKSSREIFIKENIANILSDITAGENIISIINKSFRYNFTEILVKLTNYAFEELLKNQPSESASIVLFLCVNTTASYSNYSQLFCEQYHKADGIVLLFKILQSKTCQDVEHLNRLALDSLHNLAKLHDKYIDRWGENPVDAIMDVIKKYGETNSDMRLTGYILFATIASEDHIIDLHAQSSDPILMQVIGEISEIIGKWAIAVETKEGLTRMAVQLKVNEPEEEVCCNVVAGGVGWHLFDLLGGLYHLAVNDCIKYEIYHTFNLSQHLRSLILRGVSAEVRGGLELLHQLCFDQRIAEHVLKDGELFDRIKELAELSESLQVKKRCKGIIWLIDRKVNLAVKTNIDSVNSTKNEKEERQEHIMISYNSHSRDLCLEIKKKLEESGFPVWIDTESIHGSSLESMANAVESSFVVLMCMTEMYKQSSNCRAEAEYAYKLGKPIIPLIMQKGYNPNGWLGIILGSKIYIDFIKHDLNVGCKRLIKEIEETIRTVKPILVKTTQSSRSPVDSSCTGAARIESWSTKDVEEWLKEKKIERVIADNIHSADGKILCQIYKMKSSCPEFFYCSVSSNHQATMAQVAKFGYELSVLFGDLK